MAQSKGNTPRKPAMKYMQLRKKLAQARLSAPSQRKTRGKKR